MQSKFEEQFTAYIDLLGFKDAVSNEEKGNISKINGLLTQISKMRSKFAVRSEGTESIKTICIKPMITTFSDHIVISYPLKRSCKAMGDIKSTLITMVSQVNHFTAQVAEDALRIGLLVRGGATIGKLYHTPRVIFGKALIEAYYIESEVSNFPRVVLSPEITSQFTRSDIQGLGLLSDDYGWYHFDYFKRLAKMGSISADGKAVDRAAWAEDVKRIVSEKLTNFDNQIKGLASKRLTKLEEQIKSVKQAESLAKAKAKWAWFGNEFCSGVERSKSQPPKSFGYATDLDYSPV
jgi:hypothetical protein